MLLSAVRLVCALLIGVSSIAAMQIRELELISPITGQHFRAVTTPLSQSTTHSEGVLADMGSDDDGCRHSTNMGEYDRYVVTDPTSYFSALAIEWDDRTGRFTQPLSNSFKEWVLKQFNTEFKADWTAAFNRSKQIAAAQGQLPPDRAAFVMGQDSIPVEKRFALALECYGQRGARPAVLAKLALNAAWALRTRAQLPITDPRLAGGMEEVNNLVMREVKDREGFSLQKWYGIYRSIFDRSRLTPSGYFVAGQVLFGFEMRRGDVKACEEIVEKMLKRFEANKDNSDGLEFHRGLVRSMKRTEATYRGFLDTAALHFRTAVAQEEFTRARLPEILLAVAECLRRAGRTEAAMDWYQTLALLPETQRQLRADIRTENRFPSPTAPYLVQLGWIADTHIAELKKLHPNHPDKPSGADTPLLTAILFEGLGTVEYKNPNWQPASGATDRDSAGVLDLIGKGVLLFHERLGEWPESLGELWAKDLINDRNRLNRFHCPATGAPYAYVQPLGNIAPRTILVAGSQPIVTEKGRLYPAYLANNTLVWSAEEPKPGTLWLK